MRKGEAKRMENPRKPQSGKGAGYGKPTKYTNKVRVELGHVVQEG